MRFEQNIIYWLALASVLQDILYPLQKRAPLHFHFRLPMLPCRTIHIHPWYILSIRLGNFVTLVHVLLLMHMEIKLREQLPWLYVMTPGKNSLKTLPSVVLYWCSSNPYVFKMKAYQWNEVCVHAFTPLWFYRGFALTELRKDIQDMRERISFYIFQDCDFGSRKDWQ